MCEHVVQEAYAAVYFIFADTVEIKLDGDVSFLGLSVNLGYSVIHKKVLFMLTASRAGIAHRPYEGVQCAPYRF